MKYYSVINKNETLPLMTTWVDHEVIVVNEISHTKKDKYHWTTLTCRIKKNSL